VVPGRPGGAARWNLFILSNFDKHNKTQEWARLALSYFPVGVEPQEKLLQVNKGERDVKKPVNL